MSNINELANRIVTENSRFKMDNYSLNKISNLVDFVHIYLKNTPLEEVESDWREVNNVSDPNTVDGWFDLLKQTYEVDIWANEMYSIGLRCCFGNDRKTLIDDLSVVQDEVLDCINYDAKHRDKEAKEFTKTCDLGKYGIIEEVRKKWYKAWKRNQE